MNSTPTEAVGGPGRTGLRDAHAHLPQHGRAAEMVQLSSCTSKADCLALLAARADEERTNSPSRTAGTDQEPWILGGGLRVAAWAEPTYPTAQEIDEAVGGRCCCAWSFDYHAIAASTSALHAAGISHASTDPEGGVIVRDVSTGEPTGLVLEAAAHLVWNAVPEPTMADRRRQVRAGVRDMQRLGFVEMHDLHAPRWLGPMLAEMDDADELGMHLELFAPLREIEAAYEEARAWQRDRVRLAGAKIFVDGTLNSKTAWMLSEYADPLPGHPRGMAMMTAGELDDAVRRVDAMGLPLAAHAIGDGAVRAVLDAIERVRPRTPGFRIEHAEVIDETDVPRFADLGVICSPQPCHLLADIEALTRLLPHRLDRVLPLRDLIDAGAEPGSLLLFGSDTPIVRPDPQDSVQAAVSRRRADMPDAHRIAPAQAISADEAWAAFAARPAGI
ncbi:amidohydrolase family protein [Roseiflexus sp. AH-315-K22]|nr:amidohydrolase family protein [Roseiflexus sp. AH-315-K22]